MQNKRMNIAAINPQQTHALGPYGTYGDLSDKTRYSVPFTLYVINNGY